MLLKVIGNDTFIALTNLKTIAVAEQTRPDVVLLDIGLPNLIGFHACRRIRNQLWGKNMLLVALNADRQEWSQCDRLFRNVGREHLRTQSFGFDLPVGLT